MAKETKEKKAPKMFKAKGQSKKFYVDKAMQHYITAEAELRTVLKLNYVDENKLDELKKSVEKNIEDSHKDLYSYLSGKSETNNKYEELLNSLDKEE